ncbi:MAG: permease [Betaproteobacteria bacterium]|nr:permease [Betaproteobacteria bacterium]
MHIPVELHILLASALIVSAAYIIFGISAFGAALFTVPALSYLYPLDFVLPVCVLLDVSAAIAIGTRFSRESDKQELLWMAPACLIGAVLGVTLLVSLSGHITLIILGAFLLVYGIYMLRQGPVIGIVSRRWAPVAGFVGGAMGTLFGIGAPPYAIYLSRRLMDKDALRATLSNMVVLSTGIRALVFAVGGLMLADRLIVFALLLPFALAGLWMGNCIHGRISREQVARVMSVVLILIGGSLLVRALS